MRRCDSGAWSVRLLTVAVRIGSGSRWVMYLFDRFVAKVQEECARL